ncbi:MAG: hypothetical protein C4537_00050 [Acholeplasma sp.]|jgi:hypothetical protein|nr:MAG: hypothetical protein C4537_00050 [Acholeplasma sp.]
MDDLIYFVSLITFFAISLRILRALHIENHFEKFKLWEIKAAYFLGALMMGHMLAEVMVRISLLLTDYFN